MNIINDKIKYYTNIILSGTMALSPLLWNFNEIKNIDGNIILTMSAICILFVGRICLEFALIFEDKIIDDIVSYRVNKKSHYVSS